MIWPLLRRKFPTAPLAIGLSVAVLSPLAQGKDPPPSSWPFPDEPPAEFSNRAKIVWNALVRRDPQYSASMDQLIEVGVPDEVMTEVSAYLEAQEPTFNKTARTAQEDSYFNHYVKPMLDDPSKSNGIDFDPWTRIKNSFEQMLMRKRRAQERPMTDLEANRMAKELLGLTDEKATAVQPSAKSLRFRRLILTLSQKIPSGNLTKKEFAQWKQKLIVEIDREANRDPEIRTHLLQARRKIRAMKWDPSTTPLQKTLLDAVTLPPGMVYENPLSDPLIAHEYRKLVFRLEQQTTPDSSQKFSKTAFEEWKRQVLTEISRESLKDIRTLLAMRLQRGEIIKTRSGVQISPEDLNHLDIKNQFKAHMFLLQFSKPGGQAIPFTDFSTTTTEDIQVLGLELHPLLARLNQVGRQIQDLPWNKNPEIIRQSLKSIISAQSKRVHHNNVGYEAHINRKHHTVSQIWWWGIARDPSYWAKREARAREEEKPPLNLASLLDRSGISGETGASILRGKNPIPPGLLSNLEVKNDSRKALNIAIFDVKTLKPESHVPDFFVTVIPEPLSKLEYVFHPDENTTPSVRIEAIQGLPLKEGLLSLPTPPNHDLRRLEIKGPQGEPLEMGEDYRVFSVKDHDGYFIQFKQAKSVVFPNADFSARETERSFSPRFSDLDPVRVRSLAVQLDREGFTALAAGIEKLILQARALNTKVSIRDLEHIFADTTLYSYEQAHEKERAPGMFDEFRKYLDEHGNFCAQCTGSYEFFGQFLKVYFGDDPNIKINRQNGIKVVDGRLSLSGGHTRGEIRDGKSSPLIFDATGSRKDPRSVQTPTEDPLSAEEITSLRLNELIGKLKIQRAQLVASLLKLRLRNLENREPARLALQLSRSLLELLEGTSSFEETKQRIKPLVLDPNLDSADSDGILDSISGEARKQTRVLKRYLSEFKSKSNQEKYSHYFDFELNSALLETLSLLDLKVSGIHAGHVFIHRAQRLAASSCPTELRETLSQLMNETP